MIRAWDRWAFTPVDTAPMAALRVVVGLLTIGWTLSLLPDAETFLGSSGLQRDLPEMSGGAWVVPLGEPRLVLAVLLAAAVALTLGWRTRVASVLVAVLLLAVQRRDPFVLNSGDLLLRQLAFFVMLMPAGETWSLDARRRGFERLRAPWALRLLQLQLSAVYLSTVWQKVRGETWNDGTAVSYAWRIEDLERFALPSALTESVLVANLATYGTLALELALAVLVWNRAARPYVLLAGVGLHLGIDVALRVGFFSATVLVCYLSFLPPATSAAVVARARDVLARRPRLLRLERGTPTPPVRT